jgi:hypothetical protein
MLPPAASSRGRARVTLISSAARTSLPLLASRTSTRELPCLQHLRYHCRTVTTSVPRLLGTRRPGLPTLRHLHIFTPHVLPRPASGPYLVRSPYTSWSCPGSVAILSPDSHAYSHDNFGSLILKSWLRRDVVSLRRCPSTSPSLVVLARAHPRSLGAARRRQHVSDGMVTDGASYFLVLGLSIQSLVGTFLFPVPSGPSRRVAHRCLPG